MCGRWQIIVAMLLMNDIVRRPYDCEHLLGSLLSLPGKLVSIFSEIDEIEFLQVHEYKYLSTKIKRWNLLVV